MALDELERKLEESFAGLRTENKNLIDLLKVRQFQLKSSITGQDNIIKTHDSNRTSDKLHSFNSSSGTKYLGNNPPLTNASSSTQKGLRSYQPESFGTQSSYDTSNADLILTRTEQGHRRAREMLSQRVKPDIFVPGQVCFDDKILQSDHYVDLSSDDEGSKMTSTPNLTPIKQARSDVGKTTPKSILKRRKIIDDNVHVQSRYQDTLGEDITSDGKTGLNFSYSDEDEPNYYPRQPTGGSFIEENSVLQDEAFDKSVSNYLDHRKNKRKLDNHIREIEQLMGQRLLDDQGNDRQHANIVKVIGQRPKNDVFDVTLKEPHEENLDSTNTYKKSKQYISSKRNKSPSEQLDMNPSRDTRPLLGYDWIASVLENEGVFAQSESLFNEIEEFRRKNKEECIGKPAEWDTGLDLRRPVSPEVDDPGHTCIHSYTVNDRLFTQSVNLNEEGKSICPVCLVSRRPPTREDPAFVRVSIPKSALGERYKVKPHTRKSFDPTDSFALSKHCLAGWNNTKPAALPTASTLDLKDKILQKETTTYDEARKIAESFSQMGRLYQGKHLSEDKIANELRNRTNCLRYELDIMKDMLGQQKLTIQKI